MFNPDVGEYNSRMGGRQKIICIVDDEPSVRRALSRLLNLHGFETRLFASAREYLDDPCIGQASCLLIDVAMSGIDGYEMLTLLNASGRSIPTVIISAHPDKKSKDRAKSVGAADFLHKPCSEGILMDAIDKAIMG